MESAHILTSTVSPTSPISSISSSSAENLSGTDISIIKRQREQARRGRLNSGIRQLRDLLPIRISMINWERADILEETVRFMVNTIDKEPNFIRPGRKTVCREDLPFVPHLFGKATNERRESLSLPDQDVKSKPNIEKMRRHRIFEALRSLQRVLTAWDPQLNIRTRFEQCDVIDESILFMKEFNQYKKVEAVDKRTFIGERTPIKANAPPAMSLMNASLLSTPSLPYMYTPNHPYMYWLTPPSSGSNSSLIGTPSPVGNNSSTSLSSSPVELIVVESQKRPIDVSQDEESLKKRKIWRPWQ